MPFIFANFNGTKGDVEVFTHEIGHAFQNWSSRDKDVRRLPLADVRGGRGPLDEPRVPDVAAHGEVLRRRRRALPSPAPDRVAALPALRRAPWTTSSTWSTRIPHATPAERLAMWKEMRGGPTCRGATGATSSVRPPAACGRGSCTSTARPSTTSTTRSRGVCAHAVPGLEREDDRRAALEAYVALCRRGRRGALPGRSCGRRACAAPSTRGASRTWSPTASRSLGS